MAHQLLIDQGFFGWMAKLTANEQKQVTDFINQFNENPAHPSLQLHALDKARSKGMWSGRVSQDVRVILHRDKEAWVLLHVDHHDPAYRWAERRDVGRHPVTGALQIVETIETIKEIEKVVVKARAPALFEEHDDNYLASLGVPLDWLPAVRKISSDDQLFPVIEKLPPLVAERLLDLASGAVVTPPQPIEPGQPLTASAETRSHFYVVDDAGELAAALAAPLDRWIAFLHPSQRNIVEAKPKGPVKISGSAGTGKTVVAMHRARHLARAGLDVLFTSFAGSLCENVERNLDRLCGPDERKRITVSTVHALALKLVQQIQPKTRPANDEQVCKLLDSYSGGDKAFVRAEWDAVVGRQGIDVWEEYRSAKRTGRGRPLPVAERKRLWKIFETVRAALKDDHLADFPGICRQAERLIAEGKVNATYQAVIVDELQDLQPAELRLVRALSAANPANLLLAGDAGQRIYGRPLVLSALGIDVRGRSHVLRLNYRTTEQIRRCADELIATTADDLDGGEESRRGTRSLLKGPQPTFAGYGSAKEEAAGAVTWVKERLDSGLRGEDLACFARTNKRLDEVREALKASAVGVSLLTMHKAKGLEFKAVLVMDCGAGSLPHPSAVRASDDPQDREAAMSQEKNLLYVAMTRARDLLKVTWSGKPSTFLGAVRQ